MKFNYITREQFENKIEAIVKAYKATNEQADNAALNDEYEDGTRVTAETVFTEETVMLFALSLESIVNDMH